MHCPVSGKDITDENSITFFKVHTGFCLYLISQQYIFIKIAVKVKIYFHTLWWFSGCSVHDLEKYVLANAHSIDTETKILEFKLKWF